MSDSVTAQIIDNTPEQVAYKLMRDIAAAEKIYIGGPNNSATREWIIATYCQCLMAVRNFNVVDEVLRYYPPKG